MYLGMAGLQVFEFLLGRYKDTEIQRSFEVALGRMKPKSVTTQNHKARRASAQPRLIHMNRGRTKYLKKQYVQLLGPDDLY